MAIRHMEFILCRGWDYGITMQQIFPSTMRLKEFTTLLMVNTIQAAAVLIMEIHPQMEGQLEQAQWKQLIMVLPLPGAAGMIQVHGSCLTWKPASSPDIMAKRMTFHP